VIAVEILFGSLSLPRIGRESRSQSSHRGHLLPGWQTSFEVVPDVSIKFYHGSRLRRNEIRVGTEERRRLVELRERLLAGSDVREVNSAKSEHHTG